MGRGMMGRGMMDRDGTGQETISVGSESLMLGGDSAAGLVDAVLEPS